MRTLLSSLCGLLLVGCLSQTPPPQIRWFLPEVATFDAVANASAAPLRLLPVTSSAHLRDAMVWRLSPVEIFFDEQERWGAQPAAVVQSELEQALFASGAFSRDASRAGSTLEVVVSAFGGVYATEDHALCEFTVVHDDGKLVRQRSFRATSPLGSREPEELARGLGRALHSLILELRDWARTSG